MADTARLSYGGRPIQAQLVAMAGGSGVYAAASFIPAAASYTANDIMGATGGGPIQEFIFYYADSGLKVPANALVRITTTILKIDQTALQASEGAYVLQTYNATPPSAQADNDAWTLASADLSAWRAAPLSLGTPVDYGSACAVRVSNVDTDIRLGANSSLFGEIQTLATFTATAVARQVGLIGYLA